MRRVYGVIACLLMVSVYAQEEIVQWCIGDCGEGMIYAPRIDPVEAAIVMKALENRNRAYTQAAARAARPNYGGYTYMPNFQGASDLGLGTLSGAAATRGEYQLELQRRSLCAGFASTGADGVYAGRALDCRRDVFD